MKDFKISVTGDYERLVPFLLKMNLSFQKMSRYRRIL